MPQILLRLALRTLVGWLLFRRVVTLLIWAILISLALLLGTALIGRAAPDETVIFAEPLSAALPEAACPTFRASGAAFATIRRDLVLPEASPRGMRLLLAGDASGQGEIRVDDAFRLSVVSPVGEEHRLYREFRSLDRQRIVATPPLDLTGLIPPGASTIVIEFIDLLPPTCSSSALFLVGLGVASPTPSATMPLPRSTSPRAAVTSQTAAPVVATAPPSATPSPTATWSPPADFSMPEVAAVAAHPPGPTAPAVPRWAYVAAVATAAAALGLWRRWNHRRLQERLAMEVLAEFRSG